MRRFQETWNQWFGRTGEDIARRHLRKKGYRILHSRYRTPYGEIDLIAKRGDILSFVEVKTRRPGGFGDPLEAITPRKVDHMHKAAHCFLLRNPSYQRNYFLLFEVIAIRKDKDDTEILQVSLEL